MGMDIGVAFQIKDDLFDYGDNNVGKPTGIDIIEKKMTLPLIFALQNATASEKRRVVRIIKKSRKSKKEIKEVISFVMAKGGLEYATEQMMQYKQRALDALAELSCEGSTDYLKALVEYVIERKK